MSLNRIQFQRGVSMREFHENFGTEPDCERALERARWPHGFRCPECGGTRVSCFRHRGQPMRQCCGCRRQTSLRAGTLFEHSKLPLRVWFLALHLLTQAKNNVAALELMRHLGVCYRTAWRIKHKLMQAMTERESGRRLSQIVQIDDAYLGGERSGKRGRGSENKQAFVIAVETTEEGHPVFAAATPLHRFTKAALSRWFEQHVEPSARVVSDGLTAFQAAAERGLDHRPLMTGGRKAGCDLPEVRWVNTVLGNLKRSLDGTYHAVKFAKYTHRYLAEAVWRFNRRFNLRTIGAALLRAAAANQPWTETRLRGVASCLADARR